MPLYARMRRESGGGRTSIRRRSGCRWQRGPWLASKRQEKDLAEREVMLFWGKGEL